MKKLLTFISIISFLFLPWHVYGQTITPSSQPSPSSTISPTPSNSITPTPSNLIVPSPWMDQSATPSATVIETGDTTIQTDVLNNTNLNSIGNNNCQSFVNVIADQPNTIDLSKIDKEECIAPSVSPSPSSSPEQNTAIDSIATISATIKTDVNTGQNLAVDNTVIIETGDVTVETNISNIVNTNIVGDNTYFGVINIFEPLQSNIILPYELDFIQMNANTVIAVPKDIHVENTAQITTESDSNTQTGENLAVAENTMTESGDWQMNINVMDLINHTNIDSNYILVQIHRHGTWDGSVQGWWGNTSQDGNMLTLWYKNPYKTTTGTGSIVIDNAAVINTNIKSDINTGTNIAAGESVSIKTGDIVTQTDVFNMANTSMIGNNWYHVLINMFEDVKGDVIFPRPDLNIAVSTNKKEVKPGENVDIQIHLQNEGNTWAKDTTITAEIPDGAELISASHNGIFQDRKIQWNLGKIQSKVRGTLRYTLRPLKELTQLIGKITAKTSTDEPDTSDNETSFTVAVTEKKAEVVAQISPETVDEPVVEITPQYGYKTYNQSYQTSQYANPYQQEIRSTEKGYFKINEEKSKIKRKALSTAGIVSLPFIILSSIGLGFISLLHKFPLK